MASDILQIMEKLGFRPLKYIADRNRMYQPPQK